MFHVFRGSSLPRPNKAIHELHEIHEQNKALDSEYDLIIIGAGINGAGIARDAAMRGLKVLLLDKGDIGGGTSAWSTRLIHGGLRYLEHGELGLVRESLRERETLLTIAPHLVKPIPIVVPIYEQARRGLLKIRFGMFVYDLLSFFKSVPGHRMLLPQEVVKRFPALESKGLKGAAIYYDAQVTFPERLVVENVLSATEYGARVLTYAKVTEMLISDECVAGVVFTDQLTSEQQTAEARIVINAAGPWIDHVIGNDDKGSRLIGGTKGSHLVVSAFPAAPKEAIYVEASEDNRPFFIIPWNKKYLIGTTDIRFEGDPDQVAITGEEIDYLLKETNRVLPSANLTRKQILFTYSGVRPLPFTGDKHEASITRRHFIRQHPRLKNLFSIVGGKLTTYRQLSKDTVDLGQRQLKGSSRRCETAERLLPGANVVGSDFEKWKSEAEYVNSLDRHIARRLKKIYGTRAAQVAMLIKDNPVLAEQLDRETGAIAAEVVYAFERELARTLTDCLLRRMMVGLNSRCGLDAVDAAADVGQKFLGWSDERCAREVGDYRKAIEGSLQKHLR